MKVNRWLAVTICSAAVACWAQESLTGDALKDYFVGKTVTMIRDRDGAAVHLEAKSDGTLYQHTVRAGRATISSTGKWRMNDNGYKFCMDFTDANASNGCYGIQRDPSGDVLYTGPARDPKRLGKIAP